MGGGGRGKERSLLSQTIRSILDWITGEPSLDFKGATRLPNLSVGTRRGQADDVIYRCDSACRADSGACRWSAPCTSGRARREDRPLVPGPSRIPCAQRFLHTHTQTHTPDTNPVRTQRELWDGTNSSSSHHCDVFPVFPKKILRIFGQTFSRLHGFSGLEIELIKQLWGYFHGPD